MTNLFVDVVDDDAAHRKLLGILIAETGFVPRTHAAADSMLGVVRQSPPALIVVDVQLRGTMDGVELTRALKAAPETAGIPVLVVSAFAAAADEARARRAGCDAWLPKPLDTREFMSLARWLVTRWPADVEAL